MNNLFPPELRTASVVKRWSIVRTFQPDSVAEHSYYVTFYAVQIARLIEWPGPMADLMYMSLMHDVEETFIGDIVSPVKHAVLDEGKYGNYITDQMKQRLPLVDTQLDVIAESQWGTNIEKIVKVADKIDAVLFLITEQRMGNAVLAPLYQDAVTNLSAAWQDLCIETGSQHRLWDDEIWPAIQCQWKHGGNGIT